MRSYWRRATGSRPAWGIAPFDAVHTAFRDLAALEAEALEAQRDGFVGKGAIHPAQVSVINRVFIPSAQEVDWAWTVVALLARDGVASLDGKMIDRVHERMARRILERAGDFAETL